MRLHPLVATGTVIAAVTVGAALLFSDAARSPAPTCRDACCAQLDRDDGDPATTLDLGSSFEREVVPSAVASVDVVLAAEEPSAESLEPTDEVPLRALPQPLREPLESAVDNILWNCRRLSIPVPRGEPRVTLDNARELLKGWEDHFARIREADAIYLDEITRVAGGRYRAGDVVVPDGDFPVRSDRDAVIWLQQRDRYADGDHVCRYVDSRGTVFVHVPRGQDPSLDMARDYVTSFEKSNPGVFRELRGFLSFPTTSGE